MALINKFFSSRKKSNIKHQDASNERTFTFIKDQVRLVLFRECDFRGRKLLFDSQSVQKILLPQTDKQTTVTTSTNSPNKTEKYVERTNGYGYQYSRPSSDIIQLGEIVFGTVAMSFRGTSLKIHSFNSPAKLMCTQVFPSPKHLLRGRVSVASQQFDALRSNSSVQSLEKSSKFDNSSTSSTTSFNEQISLHSTESELKLRSPNGSVPLDVPTNKYNQSISSMMMTSGVKLAPSLEGDSGFCGEQSYSSVSSGPPSMSMSLWDTRHDNASVHGFSCGSLYKRWLRSASTSLDYNNAACSDSSLSTGVHSTASADECITRGHHRSSKLGLAVIIHLSEGQEIDLERFLLEHSALIEAMVCRARAGAESAYTKPVNFASLMYDVHKETSQWLVALITGPTLNCYLWHVLGQRFKAKPFVCDNITKTKSESSLIKTKSDRNQDRDRTKDIQVFSSSLLEIDTRRRFFDTPLRRSILRPLTNYASNDKMKNVTFVNDAEKFVQELCELLESVDTKHTNFFISTLMTAVLTHHLGWVSTVLPPSQTDTDTLSKLHSPCNPLWGQLSDLYGAVGSPTKVARTIICGNSINGEIISKILYTLTYFIRCSIIERNSLSRYSTDDENKEADHLTQQKPYVKPTETKREKSPIRAKKVEQLEMVTFTPEKTLTSNNKSFGLSRTKTCLGELKEQNISSAHPILDKVTSLGFSVVDVDLSKSSNPEIKQIKTTDDVIFVLGDNDQLVGLKKDPKQNNNDEQKTDLMNENTVCLLNIPGCSAERPKNLHIPNNKLFNCDSSSSDTSPELTSPNCHHSSGSQTPNSPCSECDKNPHLSKENKIVMTRSAIINLEAEYPDSKNDRRREEFNRSQSVPPSDKTQRKCSKNGCKKKYSGVKFDFKQYPQIYKNYMKSKNLPFADKDLKMNRSFSVSLYDCSAAKFDSPSCDCEPHSEETLQTPSNATELAFTSELTDKYEIPRSREKCDKKARKNSDTKFDHPLQEAKENNAIFERDIIDAYEYTKIKENKMSFVELPMPRIITKHIPTENFVGYTKTLLRGINDKYISDMVLQGTLSSPKTWEHILRRDLQLSARKPLLDQPVQEAVAIVANTDTWEVQLVSSQKYIVEKGCENRVGMSQLIANMLETLLHMWKLRIPPEYCLMHIESRLREFCIRSKALAQLLLDTEFCNMNFLTSTMQLEVNDVPLLLAVASTHSPQVTQKYGLSFQ